MSVDINMWAVFWAAVSSMVVGSIWYAPQVFGKTWQKLAKLNEKQIRKDAPKAMVIAFVSSLVMAYVLAHMIFLVNNYFGNSYMQDALTTALWVWFGFQALRTLMHDGFEQRSPTLTMISISNDLVTIVVMAAIIGWIH